MDKEWIKILDLIRDQVSSQNFKIWFARTKIDKLDDDILTISVPSTFVKNNLNSKFINIIESSTEQVWGKKLKLDFKVKPSLLEDKIFADDETDWEIQSPSLPSPISLGLNPKYTLSTFVVGLSNNLAYAASQAVIQNPGISYNPLFIYGGTGVGKTHLMQAIGNTLLQKNPHLKILYCSSERFMNDFIGSIQTKRTGDFRAKYRSCDLLLIDDIQFISGRDSTQEEFFHTFNELQGKNSQIILTSDRPPLEIQKLEPRLQSRFQGGLMVDIQNPDFDTRVAILKAKCQERGEVIEDGCLTLIAESMSTNARELEGKLISLIQITKSEQKPLTLDFVREQLGKKAPSNNPPDPKKVIASINQLFSIKMVDLAGPKRIKQFVVPRQIAMYLLYEDCRMPYERIGELLGGRDHTTIMHGVQKIVESQTRDREIQRLLIELRQLTQQ